MVRNEYLPRVLIVDDDRDMRELLATVLAGCSFSPIVKESAESAYGVLELLGDKVSVVILDWNLPGKSGIEFLRDLKRGPHRFIPVIMLSGRDDPADVQEGIKAGAFYYLPKPPDRNLLCSLTRAAVQDYSRYRSLQYALKDGATSALLMDTGEFTFRRPAEAESLSSWLAQSCPDPESARLGLFELFINGIEHGNLEISFEMKSSLIRDGKLIEEIQRRLELTEYRERRVCVKFSRTSQNITFQVRDDGVGFDFKPFLNLSPQRALASHGRGIAMANAISFDSIEYRSPGNHVTAILYLDDVDEDGRAASSPQTNGRQAQ